MMMDIFSSFDPDTMLVNNNLPTLTWMLSMLPVIIMSSSFWLTPSYLHSSLSTPLTLMSSQSSRTMGINIKGFTNILCSLFTLIMLINLTGLIPFMFSHSSHLIMTLVLGLPMWLALILSGAFNSPITWLASLLPSGAPSALNPFLVLVESVSILVRPLTLSFRLAANMTAGHIILSLIGVYASSSMFSSPLSFIALFMTQTFYIMFEVGISAIQAYIFCLLLTLYSDEHPHN